MSPPENEQDAAENLRQVLGSIGQANGTQSSWFARLVSAYLKYRFTRRAQAPGHDDAPEAGRALSVIRAACVKSAVGGWVSGAVTTGATFITAGSTLTGAIITIPIAAATIGGEMIVRALIHLDMTCDLAAIFGLHFDPADPADFWQIYGLAFGAHEHEEGADDPGKGLVQKLSKSNQDEISKKIGRELMGESVVKNLIPVVGMITSPIGNWRKTQKLGDTVRRYIRYRRAIGDSMAAAEGTVKQNIDLLIEGLWFLFIADGQLNPEEATLLAGLLRKLDPVLRAKIESRFVQDEMDWVSRLPVVPENVRDHFLHALEVAAAVDKSVSLPEQKILSRAAKALGREFDRKHVEKMIKEFEDVGVLAPGSAEGKYASHKHA